MAQTNQGKLEYLPLDEELLPASEGKVTDTGGHVPDLGIIDAQNTLPTVAGYSSFFGQGDYLDEGSLRSQAIQEIIIFRTLHGDNIQLAFCREGLYLRSMAGDALGLRTETIDEITIDMPAGQAKWIKVLEPELGPASPWEIWTFPIIENEMYIYIQGLSYIARLTSIQPDQVVFEKLDPTFIIGTDELYSFVIHAENDSEGDDNYKVVEIETDAGGYLGRYKHFTHSATLVDESGTQIEAGLGTGFSVRVEETSRTITDINVFIPIDMDRTILEALLDISDNGDITDLIVTVEGGL